MNTTEVKRLVIAGGGTAGWMAAAAFGHQFQGIVDITLIESEEIGTVGVGESTIPPIRGFNKLLGIDEQQFMRMTEATFKLGISFEGWRDGTDRYIHSFGRNGQPTWLCEFHHFWLRGLDIGVESELGDYCLELKAAEQNKFSNRPPLEMSYAYHLDASVYAKYLRKFSEALGVRRIEGKIVEVKQHPETGFVQSLRLDSGVEVPGDFFIDCTGFRGLLIEQALKTGYEDWSHWLICDSAVALQTEATGAPVPYTRAIAHEHGWRWRIPLQHRVGNGLVYCSRYMTDEDAKAKIVRDVEGKSITQPRVIKFRPGVRRKIWNKNVSALGLASGFLEPLESTSIHLIMTGITRLMHVFPFNGINEIFVDQYNEDVRNEVEQVRDFIILHYHATQRDDTPFWRECRTMDVPHTLKRRIEMFKQSAHAWQGEDEVFRVASWTQVMLGQGITPKHYHHYAKGMKEDDLKKLLNGMRTSIARTVDTLPSHEEFIAQYCNARTAANV